jgi:hypothetical protein
LNIRLDSSRRKRENGYRHPHCIIIGVVDNSGRVRRIQSIGEKQRTTEEHPCTYLELIEEVDSDLCLSCYSLCMCVECYAHEYLLPVMHLLLCWVYDFMC